MPQTTPGSTQTDKLKEKFLKDYKKPDYQILETNLAFEINNKSFTKVTSNLLLTPSKHIFDNNSKLPDLVLNGENLELLILKINNTKITDDYYKLTNEHLIIDINNLDLKLNSKDNQYFEIEIENLIYPEKNTALTGLYCSNNLYCTQCESHGFRRITYYLDRPDVMSVFTTTIIADKKTRPILLSNGNCIKKGDLENNKHFTVWHDPFKKPSYLFALVAGDLAVIKDNFKTISGKNVSLELYSEHDLISQCKYGIQALKDSMIWDEQKFGREYDLDRYMIVAVSDFNMGAMENKGLNVFNTKYVLADKKTATDQDFINVQAVIGHEYFHNWTGNRITCRDWFQLSLKEGLTVFRDQEFTSDHHSRTVKRIADVKIIKSAQFAEDASPMSHPIRPLSYIEMNNFYTVTVYNKGAEVIRMLHTLVGPENFRAGMDLYFERFDGQAVTCDDFVQAIQDGANLNDKNTQFNLTQFKNWYNQSGTPTLEIKDDYNQNTKTYNLHIKQIYNQKNKHYKPFHIPIKIGLICENKDNKNNQNNNNISQDQILELTQETQSFEFKNINSKPIPSLLRDFSAPVKIKYNYSQDDLLTLIQHDTNLFNKWDALQKYWENIFIENLSSNNPGENLNINLNNLYKNIDPVINLINNILDNLDDYYKLKYEPAFIAELLLIPSENTIAQIIQPINPKKIHEIRENILLYISEKCIDNLINAYSHCQDNIIKNNNIINNKNISFRALKNTCLNLIAYKKDLSNNHLEIITNQFDSADNMSDQISALASIMLLDNQKTRVLYLDKFLNQWKDNALLMDKWFAIQSTSKHKDTINNINSLLKHPQFDDTNPNKIYALLAAFALQNPYNFHHESGEGYKLIAEQTIRIDSINPQVASRLVRAFMSWKQYDKNYQDNMLIALKNMKNKCKSKDVLEIIDKSL